MRVGHKGQLFEPVRMNIFSEGSNIIFGSKKNILGPICPFLTFWSYQGKNIQIYGHIGQFFEPVWMKIFSEGCDIILLTKNVLLWTFWLWKGKNIQKTGGQVGDSGRIGQLF